VEVRGVEKRGEAGSSRNIRRVHATYRTVVDNRDMRKRVTLL
jgi:hypothetical protein